MNGQTVQDILDVLEPIKDHDLVFTKYKMVAYLPDGRRLDLSYDVNDDERFN